MARRAAHLSVRGCIACDELTELGAGREGWLSATDVLAALDTGILALANRSLVLLLPLDGVSTVVKIRPLEGEISAIEWFLFDDLRALAVGMSSGYLLIYSVHAQLIHKKMIHPGRILRLKAYGMKNGFVEDTSSEEVCIVMPGVVARIEGSDIKSLLQRWLQESQPLYWGKSSEEKVLEETGNSYGRLQHQLWNVGKYGPCVDAAISAIMPPPLMELQSTQRYYSAVAIGADAVISSFRLSVDRNRSLVGAILSKVVPATFSTIASFSKMIWPSNQSSPKRAETSESFAKASPLTCLKDHPRKGEKLTLSPSGSLAAITDSLGRILLLDTQALVVVRLWKGYRDASCLFMEMLVGKDDASTSSSAYYEQSKNDYCLCLAIHAPRKGIVEIWKMRIGPRLLTVQCPKGSRILQPADRFGSSSSASLSTYIPLELFLLNGESGQISVLNRSPI